MGCTVWAFVNSTRDEVAAALLAMPVHIASDSLNFLRQINFILADPQWKPPKPWGLSMDGDLWEVLVRHLCVKGPHSVKATWVKGHATEEHIAKGLTNVVCREGNNHADRFADLGC